MQLTTLIVLACLLAVACAHFAHSPAVDAVNTDADAYESFSGLPAHERIHRSKRSLLLLKKKLLLGALGLKAVKIGAVGAAGAGLFALKSKFKSVPPVTVHNAGHHYHGYRSHAPNWDVEVHSWSG